MTTLQAGKWAQRIVDDAAIVYEALPSTIQRDIIEHLQTHPFLKLRTKDDVLISWLESRGHGHDAWLYMSWFKALNTVE